LRPECIECLDRYAKDPAHRLKDIDCAKCTKEIKHHEKV